MTSVNNKRLAKNTLFMYFRMGITLLVSLYASRVILNTLGVSDYGLYNVVGGVVILFSFLNQTLSTATQRYLSIALGKQNFKKLKDIFNVSFLIYCLVALMILLLAETIGLWFLNNKMSFPQDRIVAANWVYQFSILTTCVNVLRAPFNANVIANEKMSFYAYTTIIEAFLKLIILYILLIQPFDKLIAYSILVFTTVLLVTLWFYAFNKKNFKYIILFSKNINKKLFKELLSFSGWGMFGSIANVGFRQGINIIINLFFGVNVNASLAIANQVSNFTSQFVNGFQVSLNPQLTKSYAAGDTQNQYKLIYRSSKFSFYLLLFIGLPILLNTNYILTIWLKIVPEYAVIFCQLMIVAAMIDAISAPLWVIIFATGKIRTYQIVISAILLSNVLFSYIAVKLGFGPEYMLYIRIFIFIICIIVRLLFVRHLTNLNIKHFVKNVVLPIGLIAILVVPVPYTISLHYDSLIGLIISSISSVSMTILIIYFVGMNKGEKQFARDSIRNILNKFIKSPH